MVCSILPTIGIIFTEENCICEDFAMNMLKNIDLSMLI